MNSGSRIPVVLAAFTGASVWSVLGLVETLLFHSPGPGRIPGSGDPWLAVESLVLYFAAGFVFSLILRLLPQSPGRCSVLLAPLFAFALIWALYELNRLISGNFISLISLLVSLASVVLLAFLYRGLLRWLDPRLPAKTWAAALVVLWILASVLALWNSPLRLAASRGAAQTTRPNVILITMDTTRADSLSVYGYARDTSPNLRKIASRGTLFERAYTVASWTLPSHASLFTGEMPSVHGADYSYFWLDSSEKTMAEILQEKGYATAGFVGGPFLLSSLNMAQGFSYYDDQLDFASGITSLMLVRVLRRVTGVQPWWMDRQRTAGEMTDSVLSWLRNNKSSRPLFLFINYFDPHDPYRPPAPFTTLYDPDYEGPINGATRPLYSNRETGERKKGGKDGQPLSPEDYRHLKALYDGEIKYMDQEMGRLFDTLEQQGILRNSILILIADHGESIGEHHLVDHGHSLYEEQIRVPLILAGANVPSGKLVNKIVSNIDVLPSLMELLGYTAPENCQGRSFVPDLRGEESKTGSFYGEIFEDPHTRVKAYKRDLKALIDSDWKLIGTSGPVHELYNLSQDPGELSDVSQTQPQLRDNLREKLLDVMKHLVPKTNRKQAPLDQSTLESLKANGYIN